MDLFIRDPIGDPNAIRTLGSLQQRNANSTDVVKECDFTCMVIRTFVKDGHRYIEVWDGTTTEQITAESIKSISRVDTDLPAHDNSVTLYQAMNKSLHHATIYVDATNEASIAAHSKSSPVSWSDLFIADERVFLGFTCAPPPTIHFIKVLMYSSIVFSVLAVYFDAVLPGPQGTTSHPLFFLGCKMRRSNSLGASISSPEPSDSCNDDDNGTDEPFSLMKPPSQSGYFLNRARTNTPVLICGQHQQVEDSRDETVKAASAELRELSAKGSDNLHPRVKYMIASTKFQVIGEELETPLQIGRAHV
jgi:hypothetical protein